MWYSGILIDSDRSIFSLFRRLSMTLVLDAMYLCSHAQIYRIFIFELAPSQLRMWVPAHAKARSIDERRTILAEQIPANN
jgi:hypothetical protein